MLTYKQRAEMATHPISKKLLHIIEEKKSNLCCNPDLKKSEDILQIAKQIGPSICVLKTHVDIIEDFSPAFTLELEKIAIQHNFLIFEDRKFADIGTIVKEQYSAGIYKIADWAHITNAHIISGPGVIDGLKTIGALKGRALLLLAQMSSKGAFITKDYTEMNVKLAEEHSDFVIGFICREKISDNPQFIHFTPGVKKEGGVDALGQQFLTPKQVIKDLKSDIIIVGRGIYKSKNPAQEAESYREEGWGAYLKRLKSEA